MTFMWEVWQIDGNQGGGGGHSSKLLCKNNWLKIMLKIGSQFETVQNIFLLHKTKNSE